MKPPVSILSVPLLLLVGFLGMMRLARSGEVYPTNTAPRLFGTNQGNTGDCEAEAETTALETAFGNRNLPVRLSLFYRHAYNWRNQTADGQRGAKLDISAKDKELMTRTGAWIPDYMWPEDATGIDPYRTGIRPHVTDAAAIDPDFPNVATLGYSERFFSYQGGYVNSGSIASLKAAIDARLAVTLSIHTALFDRVNAAFFDWNSKTGILQSHYSIDALLNAIHNIRPEGELASTVDHVVAVVGYDDSLYTDAGYQISGALIIRNSWNDPDEIRATEGPPSSPAEAQAIRRMRLKIAPINLPGFYAMPMQYVADLFAHQIPNQGYTVMSLNFDAFYAAYQSFVEHYRVYYAPFACDLPDLGISNPATQARQEVQTFAEKLHFLDDPATPGQDKRLMRQSLFGLALQVVPANRSSSPHPFQFARVTRHLSRNIDRLADFYGGKFSNYYCPEPGSQGIWPRLNSARLPLVRPSLRNFTGNVNDPIGWIKFFRALDASGVARGN